MDEAFDKLKKEGKNDVDTLVQWLKNAKIIDGVKVTEEKARELFQGSDPKNVDSAKFKEVIDKMAVERQQTAAELSNSLVNDAVKMATGALQGVGAFKDP